MENRLRELELEILHSMVHYPQHIGDFMAKVPKSYFSQQGQVILEVILSMAMDNSLSLKALNCAIADNIRGSDYYMSMIISEFHPNYANMAKIFIKSKQIETQKSIAVKLQEASAKGELLSIQALESNMCEHKNDEYKTLDVWLDECKDMLYQPKKQTGLVYLDDVLNGGFETGQLILISGDPEAGKTMLGLQIVENIAESCSVCFFSFEFQIQKYLKLAKDRGLNNKNIYVINEGYDVDEVANNIQNLHKKGVDVFFIDSQLRLNGGTNSNNAEVNETYKFNVLAKLCHSLNIIILLIVQTSKTDSDTPIGTKRGGHEASIIIRLERIPAGNKSAKWYKENNQAIEYERDRRIINIQKNKQTGYSGKSIIYFNTDTLRFYGGEYRNNYSDDGQVSEVAVDMQSFVTI